MVNKKGCLFARPMDKHSFIKNHKLNFIIKVKIKVS